MASNVYDKAISLMNYLRSNLEDPIKRQGQWIHYDTLEDGIERERVGKTPCVYIERVPSNDGFLPTGTSIPLDYVTVDISVIVRIKDIGTIDNVSITSDSKLLDKIIESIDTLLLSDACRESTGYVIKRLLMGGVIRPLDFKITTWRYLIN